MIAASAAAAGVYITARSLEVTRAQTAVAEQGQLADRFAKAVDQLNHAGVDHLPARVGGIYALERLARDSPRDHLAVVEVLSAFIRTAAPRPLTGASVCPQQEITADVQAALTVLGRRDATRDRTRRGTMHDQIVRVDLRRTCLQHADLTFADLSSCEPDDELNDAAQ